MTLFTFSDGTELDLETREARGESDFAWVLRLDIANARSVRVPQRPHPTSGVPLDVWSPSVVWTWASNLARIHGVRLETPSPVREISAALPAVPGRVY